MTKIAMAWKMAIEIVDIPIRHDDFPYLCNKLPEGIDTKLMHIVLDERVKALDPSLKNICLEGSLASVCGCPEIQT